MRVPLGHIRTRCLFLGAILLVAGSLAFETGKVWLAAHWAGSTNPEVWSRAARLEADNAEYWHRLGLFAQWDFDQGGLRQAILYYERAIQMNSRSDIYWTDLASAYESLGNASGAREAFDRAAASHPASSEVAWRYGGFLLRQENLSRAFAEFRRALMSDPNLTPSAISQSWKAGESVPRILNEVLPAESRYYFMALDYFLSQKQTQAMLTVWDRILRLRQPFEMRRIVPFVNELINQDRLEEAHRVWQEALSATGWPHQDIGNSSLVFNGGFENELLYGGFDWREEPMPGASFCFDTSAARSGMRSLRIVFDGTGNLDFRNPMQFVPVVPRHRYHFSAYLLTQDISTDSGIRFAIFDPIHPSLPQLLTPNVVGTQPWSPVVLDFATGPETRLLVITLRRIPSWKFDNKLRGTVWVDDVSLIPISGTKDGSP